MSDLKLVFDVYPLLNQRYTGIPQTTWHISKRLLDSGLNILFTIGNVILPPKTLSHIITRRSGEGWRKHLLASCNLGDLNMISKTHAEEFIYLSPHVSSPAFKWPRGKVRFIHDISSLTLGEFHPPETLRVDGEQLHVQAHEALHIFTVSNSSKDGICTYLSVPKDKVTVLYPGVEWDRQQANRQYYLPIDKPYFLILATREPRKNLRLIYDYLLNHAREVIANDICFAFAGPAGWEGTKGSSKISSRERRILNILEQKKLLLNLGFVPEKYKFAVMRNALAFIVPSFFEGFGSPSVEAQLAGVPLISSFGGSLYEVGGSGSIYFDPTSIGSLREAINSFTDFSISSYHKMSAIMEVNASKYNWDLLVETMLNKLSAL